LDRDKEALGEFGEARARLKELCLWTHGRGWTWQAVVALSGCGGGILAAALGSLLSAVAWARGDGGGGLSPHGLGSVLLLSTIPLLVLGAHCLDLLDRRAETGRQVERRPRGQKIPCPGVRIPSGS
jgi:hypothetical protein